jgi:hypothetical protein
MGATTPLPGKTHRMMYQLGTRLLSYELPSITPNEDALFEYAKRDDAGQAEAQCQETVNRFLIDFFERHPIGSVAPDSILISEELLREITRWSLLLAGGRREIRYERHGKDYWPVSAAKPEGPWKIVNYLKELARAHALIHGRFEVNAEDIALVSHVAISSLPTYLRPIVRALSEMGKIDSAECERVCDVTRPTARRYLLEAKLLGLGTLKKGDAIGNAPDTLSLSAQFSWLAEPRKESGRCVLEGEEKGIPNEKDTGSQTSEAGRDTQGADSFQGADSHPHVPDSTGVRDPLEPEP